jgi:hypothetical protein
MIDNQRGKNVIDRTPRKGALAYNEMDILGVIISEIPYLVDYDGEEHLTWLGVQLEHNAGEEWLSIDPVVVGHVNDFKKIENGQY